MSTTPTTSDSRTTADASADSRPARDDPDRRPAPGDRVSSASDRAPRQFDPHATGRLPTIVAADDRATPR